MISRFFKNQLKTVIEWKPQDENLLLEQYQNGTDEIKNASDLIVGPGQGCILVQDGVVTNNFSEPGNFSIKTNNHPFFTTLRNVMKSFESGNKIYLYFYKKTEITNQRWGTMMPITYIDPVYNFPIELGANGSFSMKIENISQFFEKIVGSTQNYTIFDVRKLILSRITPDIAETLANASFGYTDINKHLRSLSNDIFKSVSGNIERLGLLLTDFGINSTQFSEQTNQHIQKIINSQSDRIAAENVGLNYVEHEKVKAMRDAARNEGGLAGAGLQLGAGLEIGKNFTNKPDEQQLSMADRNDILENIRGLKKLLDEGILTEDEFNSKKQSYLDKL